MVPSRHPIFIVQIICCLHEHHAEEDAEESRCQDTTFLHAVCDGKGLRQVTIESDLSVMVLMQLDHYLLKNWGTSKLSQDKP